MFETIARHFPLITRLRRELDPDDIGRREAIVASDGANVRAPVVVVEEPERADIDPNDGDRAAHDIADTMPDLRAIADPPKRRMRVPLIRQLPRPPSRIQHELSVVLLLLPSPYTHTETFSSGRVVFWGFCDVSEYNNVNCTTLIINSLS